MKLSEKFGSFIFLYYLCSVNKKKQLWTRYTNMQRNIVMR